MSLTLRRYNQMVSHFLVFVAGVFHQWVGFVTGSAVSLFVLIFEKKLKIPITWKFVVAIFVAGLTISIFFAWQDQYTSAEWRGGEISRLNGESHQQEFQIQQLQSQLAQKDRPIILQYSGDPKLADVLKELQAKEQATKALSSKDLRDRAVALAGRMRQFEVTYSLQMERIFDAQIAAMRAAKSDDERMQIAQKQQADTTQWHANYQAAFGSTFQGEALFLYSELLDRVPADKIPTALQKRPVPAAFQGNLAGAHPVSEAADWLEIMARILYP